MTRTKATILVILVFAVALGFAVFSYYYFYDDGGTEVAGEQKTGFRSFFPFGGSSFGDEDDRRPSDLGDGEDAPAPVLRQISGEPVAGFIVFDKKEGDKTEEYIRFIIRSTGHIYETKTSTIATNRISNTTLPKVIEAKWLSPEKVFMRYLSDDNETIITLSADLLPVSTSSTGVLEYKVLGDYFDENIYDITVSDGGNSFYLKKESSSALGTKIDGKTGRLTDIFTSPITEWLSHWSSGRTIWLATKPSYAFLGYAYSLDSETGTSRRALGGLSGLSILPNQDNTKIIYSYISSGLPALQIFNVDDGGSTNIYLGGLADKCAWGKNDFNLVFCAVPKAIQNKTLPDSWYDGSYSFDDNIWKIDTESGGTEFITILSEKAGADVDAFNLIVSGSDEYLLFQNKNDLTLWSLRLSGVVSNPEGN